MAASLASFESYHRDSAWTWEKLALTRARPVCGDPGLMNELAAQIRAALLLAFVLGRLQRYARSGFKRLPSESLDASLSIVLAPPG